MLPIPELFPKFNVPACVIIAGDESVKEIGEDGDEIGEQCVKRSSEVAVGIKRNLIRSSSCLDIRAENNNNDDATFKFSFIIYYFLK